MHVEQLALDGVVCEFCHRHLSVCPKADQKYRGKDLML